VMYILLLSPTHVPVAASGEAKAGVASRVLNK
jgi:hypothetical protein